MYYMYMYVSLYYCTFSAVVQCTLDNLPMLQVVKGQIIDGR